MTGERSPSITVASLAIALLAMPLAGCISADEDVPSFESYSEAKDADGVVLNPNEVPGEDTDTTIRLKSLHPADPLKDTEVKQTELVYLLFDSETDEPVTNAQVQMQVHKTHGDHTSPQTRTPTHAGNGVYKGMAEFDKSEGWVVDLTFTVDGEEIRFPLHYHAGPTDHDHPDHFHTEQHEHGDDGHDHEH
jgi:hypothetical protein